MRFNKAGSLWGQWDLHFHTPSSFDYENKSVTNEQLIQELKSAGIVAVAVTDHHRNRCHLSLRNAEAGWRRPHNLPRN